MIDHQEAHAASAYYCSPFDDATVLTLDRGSDLRCGGRWRARGNKLTLEQEQYSPDSIGDFYGRVTELLGFAANADEHKVQWLSVGGDDRFRGLFARDSAGGRRGLRIDRKFFSTERVSHGGFNAAFYARLGLQEQAEIPESLRAHVAAGLQRAVEDAVIRLAGEGENLCLAGGSGVERAAGFGAGESQRLPQVFVQPVAGNAGTAIGAVLDERRAKLKHAGVWVRHSRRRKPSRCWRIASCDSTTCSPPTK